MEKSPRSYTLLQCSVFQCMHHSQSDTRSKSFIRRPSQDHFFRIQNLYHLGMIQKDRNNWKQENPMTGLTYKTLCKRQDGLHEMMSYTYLSPTDTWDWMLAAWKAGKDKAGLTWIPTQWWGKGEQSLIQRLEKLLHLSRCSTWLHQVPDPAQNMHPCQPRDKFMSS